MAWKGKREEGGKEMKRSHSTNRDFICVSTFEKSTRLGESKAGVASRRALVWTLGGGFQGFLLPTNWNLKCTKKVLGKKKFLAKLGTFYNEELLKSFLELRWKTLKLSKSSLERFESNLWPRKLFTQYNTINVESSRDISLWAFQSSSKGHVKLIHLLPFKTPSALKSSYLTSLPKSPHKALLTARKVAKISAGLLLCIHFSPPQKSFVFPDSKAGVDLS